MEKIIYSFISIYHPVKGYTWSAYIWDDEDGTFYPEFNGYFGHPTREKAKLDALGACYSNELPFIENGKIFEVEYPEGAENYVLTERPTWKLKNKN